ncbi:hypothetical protein HPB51_022738 [Rhipicephalus microplus]|uniref:CCHC-type domain-containing protein n=1 Tax=Rhipicephalus microplus TaxID=6941 RepID=A0A9J6EJS4_RHIMP|nr:hypothetical protein HPB51_022738 [Rhipicephalus microplus]
MPCGPPLASINAAGFVDSRAPVQLRRHAYMSDPRNDSIQRSPPEKAAWQDYPADHLQQRVRREAPVCLYCGVRGHVARFCSERHRSPLPQYQRPPASSRRASTRRNYRWRPDGYYQTDFQQTFRSDSPASVRSVTPPASPRQHES